MNSLTNSGLLGLLLGAFGFGCVVGIFGMLLYGAREFLSKDYDPL